LGLSKQFLQASAPLQFGVAKFCAFSEANHVPNDNGLVWCGQIDKSQAPLIVPILHQSQNESRSFVAVQ
jgi:hypothetical protein